MNLFTRDGSPHTGSYQADEKGKPFVVRERRCGRCGGAGGSDKWAHTGWTCYDCGGSGRRGTETLKLYTREQLDKLDAAAAKRLSKKTAAAQVRADARQAEADVHREAFTALHGELLAAADPYLDRSELLQDVVSKARERCALTDSQAAAIRSTIDKIAAGDAAKAASRHVGKIGDRITAEVTVERVSSFERRVFGAPWKRNRKPEHLLRNVGRGQESQLTEVPEQISG